MAPDTADLSTERPSPGSVRLADSPRACATRAWRLTTRATSPTGHDSASTYSRWSCVTVYKPVNPGSSMRQRLGGEFSL